MRYDQYNREERYLCAHLFRALHEWSSQRADTASLVSFLAKSGCAPANVDLSRVSIYFEVALIRDAYEARKPDVQQFMDQLVTMVARQEGETEFRQFSQLPEPLRNPWETHPRQIRHKAAAEGLPLSKGEDRVYGAIQGMFNAKPDLAIATQGALVVYEAKYTEPLKREQINRTRKIAEVWADLLYSDLGFDRRPDLTVATIAAQRFNPQVSWEWLLDLVEATYPPADRTRNALANAVSLLSRMDAG